MTRLKIFRLIPTLGIILFAGVYSFAAYLYPGGSVAFPDAHGFDWIHNFWCDLLPPISIDGNDNPARPYGIGAMILLCGIVAFFFFQFADSFGLTQNWRYAIKISGTISMICGALIFTDLHNIMIGVASIFALIPLVGIFKGLIQTRSLKFLILGFGCAVLLALCNYFYYTKNLIEYLPLFQKVALASILIWVVIVNLEMSKIDTTTSENRISA